MFYSLTFVIFYFSLILGSVLYFMKAGHSICLRTWLWLSEGFVSLFQTHYLPCSILSPQRIDRKSFYFSEALLDLASVIPNLDKVSWFCFLGGQLISCMVAEKLAREENLCLPPAFACFALEALSPLLVYVTWCNAMCLASALSLQKNVIYKDITRIHFVLNT